MTEALRTDLNDFLFTAVAHDESGMHVTMLSVLARSGVDPWAEAAGLAALSREDATQKLMMMLASVSNGPAPGADTATLAERLVAQLHTPPRARLKPILSPATATRSENPPALSFSTLPRPVRLTIYSLVALILMVMGYRALTSSAAAIPDDSGHHQSR